MKTRRNSRVEIPRDGRKVTGESERGEELTLAKLLVKGWEMLGLVWVRERLEEGIGNELVLAKDEEMA